MLIHGNTLVFALALLPLVALLLHRWLWTLTTRDTEDLEAWNSRGLNQLAILVAAIALLSGTAFATARVVRTDRLDSAVSTVSLDSTDVSLPMNLLERCLHATLFGWSLFFLPVLLLGAYRLRVRKAFRLAGIPAFAWGFAVWLFLSPALIAAM